MSAFARKFFYGVFMVRNLAKLNDLYDWPTSAENEVFLIMKFQTSQ